MKTVYSAKHVLHQPQKEIFCGEIVDSAEKPSRAESVYKAVLDRKIGPVLEPKRFPTEKITRIHSPDYIDFLRTAYDEWTAAGMKCEQAFATNFNNQHNCRIPPKTILGKMGFYLADTSLSITKGTWEAAESSAHVALTAAEIVLSGETSAFALCRPPGHHASTSVGAGYCFINNAALAAQSCLDGGSRKIAILDVDYHHGNGTQEIFYHRNDVLFCSIHADPALDFPYFSGYAEEIGIGAGEGFNQNYSLPFGTHWDSYKDTLRLAVARIRSYAPDILIVSLGVDTFEGDPISQFKLSGDNYTRMGEEIAVAGCPTIFVMEGGYSVDHIGNNATNILTGYLSR